MKINLSIIVPTIDSGNSISETLFKLDHILKLNKNINTYEIIIVPQKSKDNTFKVIKGLKLKHLKKVFLLKRGKGIGLTYGIKSAKKEWCLTLDDDLAYIEYLDNFIKQSINFDLIIASRYLKNSKSSTPLLRKLASEIYIILVKLFLKIPQRDIQAGMKMIKRNVFDKIRYPSEIGYSWDTELLYLTNKYKFKIKEEHVKLIHTPNQLTLKRAAPEMFMALLRIWWRKYNDV